MELLGIESNPPQVMSPNSSLSLPQRAFDIPEVSSVIKKKGGTNAKDESDQNQESGDSTLKPVSRIEVMIQEDPYGFRPRIKQEEASSNEGSEAPQQERKRDHLRETDKRRPCVPEEVIS